MPVATPTIAPPTTRHVAGDLRADAQPHQCEGDLVVEGSIKDAAVVHAAAAVTVRGQVESAVIDAGGAVAIDGGVVGKHKARISAKGDITLKFCRDAQLLSHADVVVQTEILQSTISSRGAVRIPAGVICGGRVGANGGVHARIVGNASSAATEIVVGFDFAFAESIDAELVRLDALLGRAKVVRTRVEPLMQNQKSLTAAQKEKAIELLYEASEAETQVKQAADRLLKELKDMDARSSAELIVDQVMHPNVAVRFPGARGVNRVCLQGPLKLTFTRSPNFTAITMTDLQSGKTGLLDATLTPDPLVGARATLARLAQAA